MYHYEVLSDEYEFEKFIQDLFNVRYKTQSFQLYKVKGAAQHGIDVFSTEYNIVIQCKKKNLSKSDKALRDELVNDFDTSLQLVHDLPFDFHIFILATTTKKYSAAQNYAAQLSQKNPFDVQFLSWTDIERLISKYPQIRERYYPHLVNPSEGSPHLSQNITQSNIDGNVYQIGGNLNITTRKQPKVNMLPPLDSIGANSLLKQAITSRFTKLGEERKKRFGKSAYGVMYRNFMRDFGIKKKDGWKQIWEWPEVCADTIIQYLDEKYNNTIGGRIAKAASRKGYVHTRPHLYKREKELLHQIGLEIGSQEVKAKLHEYFGVTTHTKLNDVEHWQWVCYLEHVVKAMYGQEI